MNYTGYELIWLFFAYSFLGWILETIGAAARQRRFVNRGLVNAPLCVIYGVAAVMITMFGSGLAFCWFCHSGHCSGMDRRSCTGAPV